MTLDHNSDPINPYESPRLQTSEDARQFVDAELDRLVRRSDVAFDMAVVVVCIVFPVIICEMGTDLARRSVGFSGTLGRAGPGTVCWIAWTAGIVVCSFVQITGGWMLGRLLRRLDLWRVVALIVVCLAAVAAWFIASWYIMPLGLDCHMRVFLVGFPGYVVQVVVSTLVASGVVVGGAWIGRRSQRAADTKRIGGDSPEHVVSSTYAAFTVGGQEVHDVGVLFTPGGREIIAVDGEKKLDRRTFALRGSQSLTIGGDDRHDVKIQWKTIPLWSVQVFVDGQRHVEELFPDIRLLFKMMMMLLGIVMAIAGVMAFVLLLMMTFAA